MTTTQTALPQSTGSGLSFGGTLNSEWIKLRSLRSTLWCYLIIIVITVGLGFLLAGTYPGAEPGQPAMTEAMQQSTWVQVATLGIGFSQLVAAVLGALVITGEYGTGMIRSTITAVPRRIPALVAKALVFGVTTFVVGLVSLVLTAVLTAPLLPGKDIHPDFGDGGVWLALVGGAGYLALIGMLSLAIGAIIRNSAGGIAASLGLILVVPIILQVLSGVTRAVWPSNINAFMPNSAGAHIYAYNLPLPDGVKLPADAPIMLESWQGLLVLVGWVVVAFVIGSILLKRRDV